jgi:hypothetical protein
VRGAIAVSREAGRARALLNAARLQSLLESRDRIELFGYAIAQPTEPTSAPAARSPAELPGGYVRTPCDVTVVLDG